MQYVSVNDEVTKNKIDSKALVEKRLIYESNYLERQVYDWIIYEIKRLLLQIGK